MNYLILCSGRTRRSGWKTLDANPAYHPDFLCTIPSLPHSVSTILWDEIEWVHGITSFYPWDAEKILKELRLCIGRNGKLIMEQPNAQLINPGDHPEWIFGDPSPRNPLHMNKWAYTPSSLTELLIASGFSQIAIQRAQYHKHPERDFRIEAMP